MKKVSGPLSRRPARPAEWRPPRVFAFSSSLAGIAIGFINRSPLVARARAPRTSSSSPPPVLVLLTCERVH
jgi:hypothetical protein